jgi:hypothetical protein
MAIRRQNLNAGINLGRDPDLPDRAISCSAQSAATW